MEAELEKKKAADEIKQEMVGLAMDAAGKFVRVSMDDRTKNAPPEAYPADHYQVDAALIGGLKIQIGDRVVDSSIQNRLKRMKDSLMRVSLS